MEMRNQGNAMKHLGNFHFFVFIFHPDFSAQKFWLVEYISVIRSVMLNVHRARKKVNKSVFVVAKRKNEIATA